MAYKPKKAPVAVVDTLVPALPPVVEIPKAPVEVAKPVVAEASKAPAAYPYVPKFRVVESVHVSLYGQVIFLRKGETIDQGGYGADGIKRLIEGGAKLEEVK